MLATRYRAALACVGLTLTCADAQRRPFTVKDDIRMVRISDPYPEPSVPGSELVWPSPDGNWAVIVTSQGHLETDKIESKLLLFDLRAVAVNLHLRESRSTAPQTLASVTANPYHLENRAYAPVIKDVRWSEDSRMLYFRAMGPQGRYRLCSAKRDGSGVRWLTPADKDVTQYDIAANAIIFTAADPGIHLIDPGQPINQDAVDITGARIQEVLFPQDIAAQAEGLFRLYRLTQRKEGVTLKPTPSYTLLDVPYLSSIYPFRASPTGAQVIKLEPSTSIPDSWEKYDPAGGVEYFRLKVHSDPRFLRADNVARPMEYTVVDLSTGRRTALLTSPNASNLGYRSEANRAAWSSDGSRVLVTNTFLPLGAGRSTENRTVPCAAATIDLPEKKVRCLYFEDAAAGDRAKMHIEDVAFGRRRDHIEMLVGDGTGKQIVRKYAMQNDKWGLESAISLAHPVGSLTNLRSPNTRSESPPMLFVHQSLNEPPTIWAKTADGAIREVWNPNLQFDQLEFGKASRYDWSDKDARTWSGILIKPVGYVAGKRYPLVLQLYNFIDGQFITDGLDPTAFAARQLASAGIAVLQIRKQPNRVSADDPVIHLEAYRSAIRHLTQDGLADPARVGVVGFSWTCWAAEEALVRDPHLFAAATIADGLDNDYLQYKLFSVGFYALQQQMDQIRGGPPFGEHLQHWVDVAPGFHLDRVQTPVRIEAINHSSVLQEWELYSSLQLLHKPVDFIFFPAGTHIHQRPLERLESQQGSVDWFRFWLKGEEDPDPSKEAQYKRWRQMRQAKREQAPAG